MFALSGMSVSGGKPLQRRVWNLWIVCWAGDGSHFWVCITFCKVQHRDIITKPEYKIIVIIFHWIKRGIRSQKNEGGGWGVRAEAGRFWENDLSWAWTVVSQQHKVDNQPLARLPFWDFSFSNIDASNFKKTLFSHYQAVVLSTGMLERDFGDRDVLPDANQLREETLESWQPQTSSAAVDFHLHTKCVEELNLEHSFLSMLPLTCKKWRFQTIMWI